MSSPFLGIKKRSTYGSRKVSADSTLSELVKQADIVFAKRVKRQAAVNGFIWCYTCPAKVRMAEADLSHYIDRGCMLLRYDERNCKPCCQNCNRVLDGNKEVFREKLVEQYGEKVVQELENKRHSLIKVDRLDLLKKIEQYSK